MKNGVKFSEPKFYVNEEQRVVVCEIMFDAQMKKHPAWESLVYSVYEKRFPKFDARRQLNKVAAKARCRKGDTFDPEIGKKIAENRAKAKAFSIVSRVWQLHANYFKKMANKCTYTSEACRAARMAELNDIETMLE